jgi:predicted exporter
MLVPNAEGWSVLMPLRAPDSGPAAFVIDAQAVRNAIAGSDATLVDIKVESDRLYGGHLREAIWQSAAGLLAILVLLGFALRSAARVLRVTLPLIAAVVVVVAGLAVAGVKLNIMHLVGILLIVAVGSNYALFFDRGNREDGLGPPPRMLASLLLANFSTMIGFGLLGFSSVPVLSAIGTTVGPGAVLALVFSALLAAPARDNRR